MAPELQQEILDLAVRALAEHNTAKGIVEKDVAGAIKKQLDTLHGHTWHVVVGKNFGSYVTHELGFFVYFYVGVYAFLVFKTG